MTRPPLYSYNLNADTDINANVGIQPRYQNVVDWSSFDVGEQHDPAVFEMGGHDT